MTNERAVEILKKLIPQPRRGDGKSTTHLMITEALDMAIEALKYKEHDYYMRNKIHNIGVDGNTGYGGEDGN